MSTTRNRTPFLVAGIVTALIALAISAAGGALLYADSEKDADGYLTTSSERFTASTHALVTDDLDLDIDAGLDSGDLGKLRLQAESLGEQPLFVGVARTADVERYLAGVEHTIVEDVDVDPFEADLRDNHGMATPAKPASRDIWVAQAQGVGRQTVAFDIEDGHWSAVVMNADGSAGVDADVSAGANAPWLNEAGWIVLGTGLLLLGTGAALIVVGVRPRSGLQGTAPAMA
jgi:hypothetical protein